MAQNLMEAFASGSTAMRESDINLLQKQYDPQNVAADAQKKQLENQKIEAQTAFEKLSTTIAQTQIEESAKAKDITQKTVAGFKKDMPGSEQQKALGDAFFAAGLVTDGMKAITASELSATREAAAKTKELANQEESISQSASLFNAIPLEKLDEAFKKMPPERQKQITDTVGTENWEAMSPVEKKQVVNNLFNNTKGKIQERIIQGRLDVANAQGKIRIQVEDMKERYKASHGKTGKAAVDEYHKVADRIEKKNAPELKKIDEEVSKAEREYASLLTTLPIYGKIDRTGSKEAVALKAALKKKEELLMDQNDEERDLAKLMDEGPHKDAIFKLLDKQRASLVHLQEIKSPDEYGKREVTGTMGEPKPAQKEKKPSSPSSQDSEALAWAKANPKDPRAAKILAINKGK